MLQKLHHQADAHHAHQTLLKLAPNAVLVGGAVRDLVLGYTLHDLDYTLDGNALQAARRLGDALGGAYYPLDERRDIGRVVWQRPGVGDLVIDVAGQQGGSLDADLFGRDFSINAIAMLPDGTIYDPVGGMADMAQQRLRTCSPSSLRDDPVRILRAVRMLFKYRLQPAAELDALVQEAIPGLGEMSDERKRDELLNILALPDPQFAFIRLQVWNLTRVFFPDLVALQGVEQSPPHTFNVYEHSLATLRWMSHIDHLLRGGIEPAGRIEEGVVAALAPFADDLRAWLNLELVPERPRWLWLRFAALAHDWGKAHTRTQDPDGRIRFFGHEAVSERLAGAWLVDYHCASDEIKLVQKLCALHMRINALTYEGKPPSRRALHRLYRALGDTAPAGLLLHLADYLAKDATAIKSDDLAAHLDIVAGMMAPAFAEPAQSILPKPLLSGRDLIRQFGIEPGPQIGELLAGLCEAQAVGEVLDRTDAARWMQEAVEGLAA